MSDISPPSGLRPKSKYFAEVGDVCINADAAIQMMRDAGTPQAKALYHLFRKHLAAARSGRKDLSPEKQREEALFGALHEAGIGTPTTKINGTMG